MTTKTGAALVVENAERERLRRAAAEAMGWTDLEYAFKTWGLIGTAPDPSKHGRDVPDYGRYHSETRAWVQARARKKPAFVRQVIREVAAKESGEAKYGELAWLILDAHEAMFYCRLVIAIVEAEKDPQCEAAIIGGDA